MQVEHRVRLRPKPRGEDFVYGPGGGICDILRRGGTGMFWPLTPSVQLQSNVDYNALDVVHINTEFHAYSRTPAIQLVISGQFPVQNSRDAEYTLACIQMLRNVTKMHFGRDDDHKGTPPPVILLDGYGTYMFNKLPVIVTNYTIDLPQDVDYVEYKGNSGGKTWLPSLSTITVQVIIQQTPQKHTEEFNWDKFATGALIKKGGWL